MERTIALSLLLLIPLFICAPAGVADSPKLRIVTTIFPLYDWSRQVGGDRVEVTQLLPPGVEAHTFAPLPEDVLRLNRADVFVYTGANMEPWAQDLLAGLDNKSLKVIDASQGIKLMARADDGEAGGHDEDEAAHENAPEHGKTHEHEHEHGGLDPHIWVDPVLAQDMVRTIAAGLAARDPANRDFYGANADAYIAQLAKLNQDIVAGLANCKQHTIIYGGHFAFGYFARRYGLEQISPYPGFSPDTQPRAIALKFSV